MLNRYLHRLCMLHHCSWQRGYIFKYQPLFYGTANASQDVHINRYQQNEKDKSKRIIQRDKRVFTFRSSGTQEASKEIPVWMLRIHQELMTDVTLPHKTAGQTSLEWESFASNSVKSLIAKTWSVAKWEMEEFTHEIAKRFDLMSLEQIISVADIFCLRKIWVPAYCKMMITYVTEMSELLDFTSHQLARLAFHLLCQGGESPEFFFLLEEKSLELISDLTLNEMAVICHSFFNSQTRIKSLELLNQISFRLLEELDSLDSSLFLIFMKTFRYSNFIKISFYHKLGDILIEKNYVKHFNSLAKVMHVAFAYASLRITHPKLFSYILWTCVQAPEYTFRIKDVSKIIWSCGTLLVNEPHDLQNIQEIAKMAKENVSHHELTEFPDNLVDLCIGLCYLNVYSDFFISIVFSSECVPSLLRLNVSRERFYQLNFLQKCLEIEHRNYNGNHLDEDVKKIISSKIGEFPLDQEFAHKKGLKQTLKLLQELLGEDRVVIRRILPHFQSSDIVVVWDKVESCFAVKELHPLDGMDTEDERYLKLAIMVTSFMQTTYDKKPLGLLHTRVRQLNLLGYQIIQINPEEASGLVHGDHQESLSLLNEKISNAIGLS